MPSLQRLFRDQNPTEYRDTAHHYAKEKGIFWRRWKRRLRKWGRLTLAQFLPSLVCTQGRLNDELGIVSNDLWPVQFALEEYGKRHEIEWWLGEGNGLQHLQLNPAFRRARLAMERADIEAFWQHLFSIREWELNAIDTLEKLVDEEQARAENRLKHLEVPTLEEKAQSVYREAQRSLGPEGCEEIEAYLLNEDGSIENGDNSIKEEITPDDVLAGYRILYERYVEDYTRGITMRALETQFLTFILATFLGVAGIVLTINTIESPGAVFGPGSADLTAPVFIRLVVLFGLLGAATSGLISLVDVLKQPVVPDQARHFAFVVGRLVVGAAGALVLHVFLLAGILELALNIDTQAASAALVVAFIGGFSERLFRRAIERVAGETAAPRPATSSPTQD